MLRFQEILPLIGELNYSWTNTESLLIYLMAGLARTDKETAIVIFLTLNTTRARIDLVERLSKLPKTATECRDEVLSVTARMNEQAKLRNKYNHCIYSFDPSSGRALTQLMRIFESRSEVKYGKIETIDDEEIEKIRKSISEIVNINRAVGSIVKKYEFPT